MICSQLVSDTRDCWWPQMFGISNTVLFPSTTYSERKIVYNLFIFSVLSCGEGKEPAATGALLVTNWIVF